MKLNNSSSWDKRQILCNDRWIAGGMDGITIGYTAFGKTRGVAFRAIERVSPTSILVSVPSLVLKDDWEHLLSKVNIPSEVVVINTLIKSTYETDLFIIDEVHRSAAETFIQAYTCVKRKKFLGLTATLERNDGRHDLILEHTKIDDNVPLQEGLDNKWVDPFEVFKIPVTLTTKEQTQLNKINNEYELVVEALPGRNPLKDADFWVSYSDMRKWRIGKKSKGVFFVKTIEKHLKEKKIPVNKHKNIIKNGFIKPTKEHNHYQNALLAKRFYQLVGKRKSLLYNAENKIPEVLKLIELHKKEYKFVMSMHIKFIDALLEHLPKDEIRVYHSKITKKQKAENKKIFEDGRTKIRTLLSVKALKEGTDIPKLSVLILAAYTSTELDKIQTFGRAIRKYLDKKVKIYYLYVPNTQEERWLNNILKNDKVIKL